MLHFTMLVVLALVSGLSFLYYGSEILLRIRLREEFDRYGLARIRVVVGGLELLGGAGVLLGLVYAPLGALAAAGLAILMALGLVVRVRLRDPARLMVPAATLAATNVLLTVLYLSP